MRKKLGELYISGWLKTHIFWAIAALNYQKSTYYFSRRKFTKLCFCFCHNQFIIMGETHSALHQEIKIFLAVEILDRISFMKIKTVSGNELSSKIRIFLCFFITKLPHEMRYLGFYLKHALSIICHSVIRGFIFKI